MSDNVDPDKSAYNNFQRQDWMSDSVDPDETAHYESSHLDLCCFLNPLIVTYS